MPQSVLFPSDNIQYITDYNVHVTLCLSDLSFSVFSAPFCLSLSCVSSWKVFSRESVSALVRALARLRHKQTLATLSIYLRSWTANICCALCLVFSTDMRMSTVQNFCYCSIAHSVQLHYPIALHPDVASILWLVLRLSSHLVPSLESRLILASWCFVSHT